VHPCLAVRDFPVFFALLTRRFQIDELIAQDLSGVVFRALDRETGADVAIRRFFPFGQDGGGLEPEEQSAYQIGIQRLSGIAHPAMRRVIAGGCDPVDGMPFIVNEWIEGPTLAHTLASTGPLEPAVAVDLLTRALETCELLSAALADEAVWVETDPATIIHSPDAGVGREFTFYISPLRWLAGPAKLEGVVPMVSLAEEILGWSGQVVGDHSAGGLGAWVNWLRQHAASVSLAEAREALAAALGKDPPKPAGVLLNQARQGAQASPKPVPLKSSSSSMPLILSGVAAALVLIAGFWLKGRRDSAEAGLVAGPVAAAGASTSGRPEPRQAAAAPVVRLATVTPAADAGDSVSAELARVNAAAAKLNEELAAAEAKRLADRAESVAGLAARGGIFITSDRELLLEKAREEVVMEGVLVRTRTSDSGLTLYFEFSDAAPTDEPRGYLMTRYAAEGMAEENFRRFFGKRVRIKGEVRVETFGGVKRPEIFIEDMESIEVVE